MKKTFVFAALMMLLTAQAFGAGGTIILKNFWYYGVTDWQYAWFRYPDIN